MVQRWATDSIRQRSVVNSVVSRGCWATSRLAGASGGCGVRRLSTASTVGSGVETGPCGHEELPPDTDADLAAVLLGQWRSRSAVVADAPEVDLAGVGAAQTCSEKEDRSRHSVIRRSSWTVLGPQQSAWSQARTTVGCQREGQYGCQVAPSNACPSALRGLYSDLQRIEVLVGRRSA
jgi:hypothetical protein